MINLKQNKNIEFYEDDELGIHEYRDKKGNNLIGVTALMKKHNLGDAGNDYELIPKAVLNSAAEKGKKLHQMLEDYDNGVAVEDSPALRAYKAKQLAVISSEYLISDNNIVASKIDKVLADGSIIDVKRTSKTYIKSLEWQLSIYAYLFEKQNKGVKVPALYCAHFLFTGNTFNDLKIIPINRLPDEKIEKLLECEKNGLLYSDDSEADEPNLSLAISEEEILTLRQKEGQIIAFEMSAKRLKEEVEQFHNRIKNYMETNNIKTMQGAKLKYTLVDAFTRKGIDSSSLEKEMPEIAEKYRKNTVVKSSLKVKIC